MIYCRAVQSWQLRWADGRNVFLIENLARRIQSVFQEKKKKEIDKGWWMCLLAFYGPTCAGLSAVCFGKILFTRKPTLSCSNEGRCALNLPTGLV